MILYRVGIWRDDAVISQKAPLGKLKIAGGLI
jgi:hypothetical protein